MARLHTNYLAPGVLSPGGASTGALNTPEVPLAGEMVDRGGNRTNRARAVSSGTGFAPGRQGWLGDLGWGLSVVAPGLAKLAGVINAGLGLNAAAQQIAAAGLPGMSFADAVYAATGLDIFGSPRRMGVGGYGDLGQQGGITGAMNFADPGVMGAARALAASNIAKANTQGIRSGNRNGGDGRTGGGAGGRADHSHSGATRDSGDTKGNRAK